MTLLENCSNESTLIEYVNLDENVCCIRDMQTNLILLYRSFEIKDQKITLCVSQFR